MSEISPPPPGGTCGCQGAALARFEGLDPRYRRTLWLVIALNASMFFIEFVGGEFAGSQALAADALDFLGDSLTYGVSLAVVGMSLRVRAAAALAKGASLALMGVWVMGETLWRTFILALPHAPAMGIIGFLALAANVASVALLLRYKDGDANVRSVWLCSRNDALGNVAAILAAAGVWGMGSAWPDLIVAGAMALLFLNSSVQILRQAAAEWRTARTCGADTFPRRRPHPPTS